MACAYPVVRQFEKVAPPAYKKKTNKQKNIVLAVYYKAWVKSQLSFHQGCHIMGNDIKIVSFCHQPSICLPN